MLLKKQYLALWAALAIVSSASADWREVAPGIEYAEMRLPGPVEVFVARADRSNKGWALDTMMAQGSAKGAMQTVPAMAEHYDETVNFRGEQYDAKVAINGSYFNMKTGVPFGGEVVGGWFVRRFDEYAGGSGFFWTLDGRAVLGGNIRNGAKWHRAIFADGETLNIHKTNDPRGTDELGLYTWQYAGRTDSTEAGVEVVVRMSRPVGVNAGEGGVPGRIVDVREGTGGTPLLYDHVVLSGHGQAAGNLRKHAKKGDELRLDLTVTDFGNEDIGLAPADWTGAYCTLPAATYILVNGNVPRHWEAKAAKLAQEGKKHGSVVKDPRTLVAFNDKYVYFVVIDGRSPRSIGMNFTDCGNFCRDELEATYAVTQDGGGSSTLWVDGNVMNHPSDKDKEGVPGRLRPVANGYLIALLKPARRSKVFSAGSKVKLTEAPEPRLGPGIQFGLAGPAKPGGQGTVLDHPLSGIHAKGAFWWNCRFPEGESWVREDQLKRP